MSCGEINRTAEEIRNIAINKGKFWRITKDDTLEDILARFDFFRRNMKLPPGEDQRYTMPGWNIKGRVSNDMAKQAMISRSSVSRVAMESKKPDNIKKKQLGIKVHQVMADLMNFLYNNIGDIKSIKTAAAMGPFAINGIQFEQLKSLTNEVIASIRKTQNEINEKTGLDYKASVLVEQPMADPISNRGGTMDVIAVFSDKRISIYDYKTIMSRPENYANGQLIDDLMGIDQVNDYALNMAEYKRIAQEIVGTGAIIQNRLIPIHARLRYKDLENWGEFDQLTTDIDVLQAGKSNVSKEHLKPIPLMGESTGDPGIDQILETQWRRYNKLSKQLFSKTTSSADKERISKIITILRGSIQKTIVDGDIADILNSVIMVINDYNTRKWETEFNEKDGSRNGKYLTDSDLQDLLGEMALYSDIIDNTHKYYGDLKESDPELFKKLRDDIKDVSGELLDSMAGIKIENEKRIMDAVLSKYLHKDREGKLLPLEELPFFTRNFTRFSDIDHPYFKAGWELIQQSHFNITRDVKEMQDNIIKMEDELFRYTSAHKIGRMDALMMLVDKKTGNLVSELSHELIQRISKAYSIYKVEDAYKELKKIYEIKDLEEYRKKYKERHESYIAKNSARYEKGEEDLEFKKGLSRWERNNDLENSAAAWTRKYNKGNLKIKDDVRSANISEEYKKIAQIKPLLDYYKMYMGYNNMFRKMLDIDQYDDLPPNFIANIRKTMVDHLAMDHFAIGAAIRELADSFHVREEDTYMSDIDDTGDVKRNIPVTFLTPFIDANGEIDHAKKSYDLSKNLMIFGKMAFNYKHMHEIEPKILQLRYAMAHPTAAMPGTKVTDKYGRGFKGFIQREATKKGIDTDTYKLFEELTDISLYGIKFKTNNLKNTNVDFTKLLLKMKQYYGKSTLAFAVIPGAAAYIAGNVSEMLEGKKGVSFTSKNLRTSHYNLVADFKKYRAVSLYFDVYAQDPTTVLIENRSVNFFSRLFTYSNLMYPLRKTDENINDSVLNAMVHNWGIDLEGKLGKKNALIRLNRTDIDTTGIKTIWELAKLDKSTGKMYIEGITDENGKITGVDAYIAFRNAVRKTSSKIIGSLAQDDYFRGDANLLYNIMFQFRTWMLGIVKERTGKLTYDESIQAASWGRFMAATSEFGLTDLDYEEGFKLRRYISKVFLPNIAKLSLDLITFGLAPKIGLTSEFYTDELGRTRRVRTNVARARRMYVKYMVNNKQLEDSLSFDQFLEVKEAQMKAMLVEARTIITFLIVIHLLGSGGGDDEKQPPYMANWFSRFMYKNLTKAQSELSFMWNPLQLISLTKSPVPMAGLLTRFVSTVMNGFDETRDLLVGENSLSDKTPFPYYLIQWIYGGGQIARLIELFKQFEKSPYTVTATNY
jgi:hypothetical protein